MARVFELAVGGAGIGVGGYNLVVYYIIKYKYTVFHRTGTHPLCNTVSETLRQLFNEVITMKKIAGIVAAAALIGSATAAQAWNGPWGGNMFGMDMGQSTGYGPGYYGAPGAAPGGFAPWGSNMFGMDMGQSAGYPAYYGAPVPPVAAPAPVTR
jgi:hypothetical protein